MEDFDALASSLAIGVGDVLGCLILSRDGLVLGAHPADAETIATPAWVRFAAIGDPERGFVQFGTETWCYVRRGPYAGFTLVGPGARPGLVIDHMDQVLLAAEEARTRHEGLRVAELPPAAPVSRPRTLPHPHEQQPVVIEVSAPAHPGPRPDRPEPPPRPATPEAPSDPVHPIDLLSSPDLAAPQAPAPPDPAETEERDDDDVDRFSLAREFGRLLQHREDHADG